MKFLELRKFSHMKEMYHMLQKIITQNLKPRIVNKGGAYPNSPPEQDCLELNLNLGHRFSGQYYLDCNILLQVGNKNTMESGKGPKNVTFWGINISKQTFQKI